jgi:enterochelin esterase-like enzyme
MKQDFPVIYLLHGYPMDETHWDRLGVDELADVKIRYGFWPPLLIVMPRQPSPLFTASDGGPGSYESEFVDGLLPFIDREYRTQRVPEARAIAGVSRGAIWALEISFRHPDLFNTVAALSPALHVNYARPPFDPFAIVQSGTPLPNWIFLSAGDEEEPFRDATEALSQALVEARVAHTFVIGPGGHNDEAWKSVMSEMMEYIVRNGFASQAYNWRWDFQINGFQVQ